MNLEVVRFFDGDLAIRDTAVSLAPRELVLDADHQGVLMQIRPTAQIGRGATTAYRLLAPIYWNWTLPD